MCAEGGDGGEGEGAIDDTRAVRREEELKALQRALRRRYPVTDFNELRAALDPNRILSNGLIDMLFDDDHGKR